MTSRLPNLILVFQFSHVWVQLFIDFFISFSYWQPEAAPCFHEWNFSIPWIIASPRNVDLGAKPLFSNPMFHFLLQPIFLSFDYCFYRFTDIFYSWDYNMTDNGIEQWVIYRNPLEQYWSHLSNHAIQIRRDWNHKVADCKMVDCRHRQSRLTRMGSDRNNCFHS